MKPVYVAGLAILRHGHTRASLTGKTLMVTTLAHLRRQGGQPNVGIGRQADVRR